MKSEPEKLGIGVIGCGVRLRFLVRKLIAAHPGIEVRAVFDPAREAAADAAREFGGAARILPSAEEVAEAADVRWVLIGSPNRYHATHALLAFAAGKDVFCEKPLATSLEDCLSIRRAWEASDRRFFFGFCLRYSPFYRKIEELVSHGRIGKILSFEFNETLHFNHGGYIMGNWRRDREVAGTHLLEKCCHDVDLANWITGSLPVRAASFGSLAFFRSENSSHVARLGFDRNGRPAYSVWPDRERADPFSSPKSVVDNQVAILQYASGIHATFHTNCNAGIPERRFYLLGSEGAIRADAMSGKVEYRPIGFETPSTVYDCTAEGGHHGGDDCLVDDLAECMLSDRAPRVAMNEGIEAAISCFGIDEAMDSGTVFDLHPLWEKAGVDPSQTPGERRRMAVPLV